MDSKQTPMKKLRSRSKSSGGDTPTPVVAEEEMAPNMNGNKDGGVEKTTAAEGAQEKQVEAKENTSTPKTRKRKANEMRSDDIAEDENPKKVADDPKEVMKEAPASEPAVPDTENKIEDESTAGPPPSTDFPPEAVAAEKHALGKGKRARVPNKRYSDLIPSKIYDSPKTKLTENGQIPDTELSEIIREESESDSGASLRRNVASPGGATHKKPKTTVDLTNPNYLKPFQYGWKRELVYRANTDSTMKRNGDIYYYTPNGKKVRSMREVAENLKNRELSIDDFTFFKEPLGIDDPEKEIIRDAKFKTGGIIAKKVTTPKISSPRAHQAPVEDAETSKAAKSPRGSGSFKVKLPKGTVGKKEKKPAKEEPAEMEIGTYPPNWKSPPKKGKTNNYSEVDSKPCQPCSIRCEGVTGLIPTLQCRLCLCLYHNECVGIPPQANIQGYVCKNCRKPDTNTGAAPITSPPPPLTPVTSLKPVQTGVLPKLQRIPKANDPNRQQSPPPPPPILIQGKELPELPKLIPKPGIVPSQPETNKSILGSVTTWFPPSSTIQVGNTESSNLEKGPPDPPRPQLVEFVGNKKYLIVPRHNILSVAQPPNPTVKTHSTDITVSTCDIKVEPNSPTKSNDNQLEPLISQNLNPDRQDVTDEATLQQPPTTTTTTNQEKTETVAKNKPNTRAKAASAEEPKSQDPAKFMDTYLQNLAFGYRTLLYVFQYLKVQDLLRAGCVCTMWRDVARHSLLWSTVRMKNSQIHSFEGLANALEQHGTVHLDLRKMLLPTSGGDDIWPSFTNAIKKVDSLRKIELCRCLASVVEELANNNHNLEAINAVTIKCESMTFEPFKNLKNLTDLRIKSTAGLILKSDLSALKELTKLKHLSITSIKDLNTLNIEVIGDLVNLEVLDIGECADFPKHFGPDILSKLVKLEKLRLEKGQGECYTFDILDAVKDLQKLHQLELVNFDIKSGFDKALGACLNIKKLLIIPTYISQSATTNHMVLGGVLKLQKTLSHFVWGVTLELLRVTELFVDQCEQPDKKDLGKEKPINNGDSIPILKPVPLQGIPQHDSPPAPDETPQVEIVPLPNLQKLLLQNLPTTRVKILKIPFHATWRQSITDSVN